MRHVTNGSLVSLFCIFCGTLDSAEWQREQVSIREKVEEASYAFPAQLAEMERYLAVVAVELESQDEGLSTLADQVYRFALSRGKGASKDKTRIESGYVVEASDGRVHRKPMVRRLQVKGHDWVGAGGHTGDYFQKPDESPTPPVTWDPITMPINYYAATEVDTSRQVINHIMPAGHLFKVEIDGLNRRVGYWRHGLKQDLGMTKVIFDPKFGNMPTEMVMRDFKIGDFKLDERNPENDTIFSQKNETKWFKHHSDIYLPKEVLCIDVLRNNTSGWKLTYEWWIGDEVPDEVFTLEDLLKADSGTSVIDRLVEKRRQDRKTQAAKSAKE